MLHRQTTSEYHCHDKCDRLYRTVSQLVIHGDERSSVFEGSVPMREHYICHLRIASTRNTVYHRLCDSGRNTRLSYPQDIQVEEDFH